MRQIFTPNPSCVAVYLSRIVLSRLHIVYVLERIGLNLSIKSFTIGNFVEINSKRT